MVGSVLAIDIGTSSAKALVVDQSGQELYRASETYPTYHPAHGFAEQNPDEVLQAILKIIRDCPVSVKHKISAISFSSAMHSVMAVDSHGNPITPLILWSDLRSKSESREILESEAGEMIAVRTGTPLHPMSPLCKLRWLKKNQPDVFTRATKFIGIKEYVWHKFFSCFEIDHGIASATGLFTTSELIWYDLALQKAGIDAHQLSEPVSVYHQRTLTNASLLDAFGFSKPVACVIGSSDGCLANLGSFVMDSDTLSLTIGTSGAVRRTTTGRKTIRTKLFRYHLDEETLIEGGATNNGGVLLEWFSKNFLNEKPNLASFIDRALQVPAGAEGLIFLPYVFGERAPLYDPDASGIFYGIRQHHTMKHFMRALLEGIGFAMYSIAGLIESHSGPYSSMVASGGFTQSGNWVQVIADIFGKRVRVNQYENASALGAAMIGFKAIRETYSFSVSPMKVFEPDMKNHSSYQDIFLTYQTLSSRSNPDKNNSL